MLDFMLVSYRASKRGAIEVYPKFIMTKSEDLMIRGSDFYAIWDEAKGLWSTDEQDAIRLIDAELDRYARDNQDKFGEDGIRVLHMWDAETGMIDQFHKYCQRQMRDNFHILDEELVFANSEITKKDYASKRLPYPLLAGDISAWDRLLSVLYTPEERMKIEWAIGAIVSGDSRRIQKFLVFYGAAGTGKSTILNIVEQLFEGYCSVFDAQALGSTSNSFALEAFKRNPLVAIQHDGDLSHIEDNTRLNSLVSHERMTVNEKFKSQYENSFKAMLLMGTNKPVRITDAKSGLIRRLIDVSPSGEKIPQDEYIDIMRRISFELGAIASYCLDVYEEHKDLYDSYIPTSMMGASNDFFNFVEDSYLVFKKEDNTSLKTAWEMYKTYNDAARVLYPLSQRLFKEELKNYFREYADRYLLADGTRIRSYYSGFRSDIFDGGQAKPKKSSEKKTWLIFSDEPSVLDDLCAEYPAQLANASGTPIKPWAEVTTKLRDISSRQLHYLKAPIVHIVADFDLKDENGNKSLEKNIEAASKWPETYAELSKSGGGIHLHYIYDGDASKLARVYDEHIEIKVFTGGQSLRRCLTKCYNHPVSHISAGLPLKEEKPVVNGDIIRTEKGIRKQIARNLAKEIHADTRSSIDFIARILDDAYNSGVIYDVTDMRNAVIGFAANSTNQSDYCLKKVQKMHFRSEVQNEEVADAEDGVLLFFDIEIFPNLFLICYIADGEGKKPVAMINPSPMEVSQLFEHRLVGFNNRRYDNHMIYAASLGYSIEQLYNLSQRIIGKSPNCFFSEAYNLSYVDILDMSSKKQSLKKFEIELGIHHQELGLPWDQPVPEEMWDKVVEYCFYDVLATKAVFHARKGDFEARKSLVNFVQKLHKGSINAVVNDTTNTLTTRLIFGKERKPQSSFNYRDLAKPVGANQYQYYRQVFGDEYRFRIFDDKGQPMYQDYDPNVSLPVGYSILPFWPGYRYGYGKSSYLDVPEIGEGGRVFARPGMYAKVTTNDVTSMHPHSIWAERCFGPVYSKIFYSLVQARVTIKHLAACRRDGKDPSEDILDAMHTLFDGVLMDFIDSTSEELDNLASALKIAINSVYGLTAAGFENPFRDERNIDNIVAKRGALFMIGLQKQVEAAGGYVVHIKTDSIKVAGLTDVIQELITNYGREFGYSFEIEAVYEKICLVNDAVYVAYEAATKKKPAHWTATGAQFQVPYVFKTLFTHEDILFEDMCETKSVESALYLDMNESLPDVSVEEKELKALKKAGGDEARIAELTDIIAQGHDYHFIGKVGSFCPIKPGRNGGLLMRQTTNKVTGEIGYASATGAKDYRWLEAEMVQTLHKESDIERLYYDALVDRAVATIAKFGDFEWFVNNDQQDIPDVAPWFSANEDQPIY